MQSFSLMKNNETTVIDGAKNLASQNTLFYLHIRFHPLSLSRKKYIL